MAAFFFAIPSFLYAGKVHLIAVADEADPTLGRFATADVGHIQVAFATQLADADVNFVVIPKGITPHSLLATIRKVPVGSDDAIFFYFSGHGAFDAAKGHYIVLTNPTTKQAMSLIRSEIIDELRNKNARLMVAMTDACFVRRDLRIDPPSFAAPAPGVTSPLFRHLFFRSRGVVDINSCSQGECAYTFQNSTKGSIFTDAFTLTLNQQSRNGSIGWDDVLRQTASQTKASFRQVFSDEYPVPGGSDEPQTSQTPARLQFDVEEIQGPDLPESSDRFGVRVEMRNGGAQVVAVTPGSPATRFRFSNGSPSRLEIGDIILTINGQAMNVFDDFNNAVASSASQMNFTIRNTRDGRIYQCTTTLSSSGTSSGGTRFGAYVESASGGGVKVTGVAPNTPAAHFHFTSGQPTYLEPGDVIVGINGVSIRDEAHYRDEILKSPVEMRFTIRNSRDNRIYQCIAKLLSEPGETPAVGTRFGAYVSASAGGGVVVTGVMANTPAGKIRMPNGQVSYLEKGDVIVSVNGEAVQNETHYRELIASSAQSMSFTIRNSRDNRLYQCTAVLLY
ncbi:PDZ domain-containing protein [Planctomicrobium sp. SH661]|uniref:PDZ domain-containing protein n=1 Tax=Planctomicrobium sp. SH661 TaxID=3448124 RepID=UPI003F5B9C13